MRLLRKVPLNNGALRSSRIFLRQAQRSKTMGRIIYSEEARNDPAKLQEVRSDLQEVGEIGEAMLDLANQLAQT